jgi:Fe2+ transport system protein FeoA
VVCPLPCKDPCPLLALPIGTRARILQLGCPLADASRLRVLGVFEGAYVRVVDRRHGILLDVRGSRLALDRAVAMDIIASPVAA